MHAPRYFDSTEYDAVPRQRRHGLFSRNGLLAAAAGLGAYMLRPSRSRSVAANLRDKLAQYSQAGTAQARHLGDELQHRGFSPFGRGSTHATQTGLFAGGLGTAALLYGMRRFGGLRTAAALAGLRYLQRRFGAQARYPRR